MRTKSIAKENFTSGIVPTAPWRLKTVKPLVDYELEVEFNDGTHGFVEMTQLIMSREAGVFSALKNKDIFNKAYLEYGVITWPGEIDLAPDAIHDDIKKNGKCILQ